MDVLSMDGTANNLVANNNLVIFSRFRGPCSLIDCKVPLYSVLGIL